MPGAPLTIRYEGPGVAAELWGGSQADFLVVLPGHPAREVAVLLNDDAASLLAAAFGQEATAAFRQEAARAAGRAWIARCFARLGHLEPNLAISRATFGDDPGLLADLKSAAT